MSFALVDLSGWCHHGTSILARFMEHTSRSKRGVSSTPEFHATSASRWPWERSSRATPRFLEGRDVAGLRAPVDELASDAAVNISRRSSAAPRRAHT
jgi:hypothetical protein